RSRSRPAVRPAASRARRGPRPPAPRPDRREQPGRRGRCAHGSRRSSCPNPAGSRCGRAGSGKRVRVPRLPAMPAGTRRPAHRPRTSGPPPAATIVDARMHTRLLWRRSATALGLYGSVALGFLASIVAARRLGPVEYGHFTLAIFAAGFFQVLLDLTVEEAMIKYGFRYTTTAQWGRLRRLYRRALGLKTLGALLPPIALSRTPTFADTLFTVSYIPEAPAGAALVLTGRYDVRAAYTLLTQLLRAIGLVIGSRYGVTDAVIGLVIGQLAGSVAVGRA